MLLAQAVCCLASGSYYRRRRAIVAAPPWEHRCSAHKAAVVGDSSGDVSSDQRAILDVCCWLITVWYSKTWPGAEPRHYYTFTFFIIALYAGDVVAGQFNLVTLPSQIVGPCCHPYKTLF